MDLWVRGLVSTFDTLKNDSKGDMSLSPVSLVTSKGHDSTLILLFLVTLLIARTLFARFMKLSYSKTNPDGVSTSSSKSIPILPSLPILRTLYLAVRHMNDLPKLIESLMSKYGSNGWRFKAFGKDIVILNNAAMIQKLLASGDKGHVQKPSYIYFKMFLSRAKYGLISSEVDLWKSHRPVINKAFTYEYLKSYLGTFSEHAEKLIEELDSTLTSSSPNNDTNFSSLLHIHTLGMISHIVTGSNILSFNESCDFHENFERYKEIVSYRFRNPWLIPDFTWQFHPYGREIDKIFGNLETCVQRCLKRFKEDRKNEGVRSTDMNAGADDEELISKKSIMDVMIGAGMSDEEIFPEVLSLVVAGHETVSMTLNFLMFNLALNPEWQLRCRQEIDDTFEQIKDRCDQGSTLKQFTVSELSDLKCLERCINETMRLLPVLPVISRELGSPLKIDDNTELREGTIVFVSAWMLHRHPEYYPHSNKFDPDRFLSENCRTRSSYAYQPFSAGPRNCVGWKMAMLEMKLLAAHILHRFEVYTSDRLEDIKFQYNLTILPHKTLCIKLKRR